MYIIVASSVLNYYLYMNLSSMQAASYWGSAADLYERDAEREEHKSSPLVRTDEFPQKEHRE